MPMLAGAAAVSSGQVPNNVNASTIQRNDAVERAAQSQTTPSVERPGAPVGAAAMTAQAVRPTPAAAPAVKVDFASDALPEEIHYPVTGPDKFAKAVAVESREAYASIEDAPPPEPEAKAPPEERAPPPLSAAAQEPEVAPAAEPSPGARVEDIEAPESAVEYASRTQSSAPRDE